MMQDEFKDTIERGTGRAMLLRKAYPQEDFSAAILNASIHNCAYDAQCESSRAEYLNEIISLSPQSDYLRKTILDELGELHGGHWDLQQLFALAKAFCLAGDAAAKGAMYAAFQALGERQMEFVGTETLIELDGLRGLLFIAEVKGKRLLENPDYWEDDWDMVYTKDVFPQTEPGTFLQEQARQNQLVKAYVDGVAKCLAKRSDHKPMIWDYAHFQEWLALGKRVYSLWGRKLSPDDRLRIAHELRHEEKPDRLVAYLSVFTATKYPLAIEDLLKYATGHDERIQAKATLALKFFQDDRVRALALHNWQAKIHVWESAEAMVENFREEDSRLLETMLPTMIDQDAFHSAALAFLHIVDKNPTPTALGVLSAVYRHGYCSNCRGYAIGLMISNNILPDGIAQEAVWDCDADTRTAVRKYLERGKVEQLQQQR